MEVTWPDPKDATEALRKGSPVHERLALTVAQQEVGSVVLTMDHSKDIEGSAPGTVHGGVLATLADAACAMCLNGHYDMTIEHPVTTDMHVRYYRQPQAGPLKADAKIVHRGRRLMSAECSVLDANDRILIRSTATYMLVPINPDAFISQQPDSH
jgi:uncharacterized protein (TIGR00369 family)